MLYVICSFFLEKSSSVSLLNEDVSEGSDGLVSVVPAVPGYVSTRDFGYRSPSTKPDSGIRGITFILLVSDDTNSHLRIRFCIPLRIEPFSITVALEGGFGTNQSLPCISTQRGCTVLTISNEGIQ